MHSSQGSNPQKDAKKYKDQHTEHGHVLLAVKVPVAPVGSVAVQGGVFLVVVSRLGAKGVNHSDVAPGTKYEMG